MDLIEILGIAIGLSVDSFAASLAAGAASRMSLKRALKVAFFLSLFQGTAPFLGWLAGAAFRKPIEAYDHWIAFSLLLAVGGKMIYDGFTEADDEKAVIPWKTLPLIVISVATSVDALVVGVGFGVLGAAILIPCAIIGIITFAFSMLGAYLGTSIGAKYNFGFRILGGAFLIGLGAKILTEHLTI